MNINQLVHGALYLAVGSALSPALAHAAGPVLADGIHADVLDSTIETTAANTSGIQALNGGTVNAANTDSITSGESSHGLLATGSGSHITFTGGSLKTTGDSADGANASSGGTIFISGTSISAGGVSHGMDARGAGSAITVGDSEITMTGPRGSALFADLGGAVNAQRVTIRTTGERGQGVLMGKEAVMDVTDSTIHTAGNHAIGAYVTGGQFNSTGTEISTVGMGAHGLYATGGMINAIATGINTSGLYSHGVVVDNVNSVVSMDGGTIVTAGQEANGLYATAGTLQIDNLDISTTGLGSIGVFARGAEAEITLSNSHVTTSNRGHAAAALAGAQLHITGSRLTTSGGAGINGITARNAGTHVTVIDSAVRANGADSHGVLLSDGASGRIDSSHIRSNGDRGRGVWIMDGSSLSVSNSLIEITGDSSVDAAGNYFGASAAVVSSGAQIQLDNTQLVTTGERAGGLSVELPGSIGMMTGGEISTSGLGSTGAAVYGGSNLMELHDVHVITTGEGARGVVAGDSGSQAIIVSSIVETQGTASHGLQTVRGAQLSARNVQVQTHGNSAAGASVVDGSIHERERQSDQDRWPGCVRCQYSGRCLVGHQR